MFYILIPKLIIQLLNLKLIVGGIFPELKETIQNQEKLHRAFRK